MSVMSASVWIDHSPAFKLVRRERTDYRRTSRVLLPHGSRTRKRLLLGRSVTRRSAVGERPTSCPPRFRRSPRCRERQNTRTRCSTVPTLDSGAPIAVEPSARGDRSMPHMVVALSLPPDSQNKEPEAEQQDWGTLFSTSSTAG